MAGAKTASFETWDSHARGGEDSKCFRCRNAQCCWTNGFVRVTVVHKRVLLLVAVAGMLVPLLGCSRLCHHYACLVLHPPVAGCAAGAGDGAFASTRAEPSAEVQELPPTGSIAPMSLTSARTRAIRAAVRRRSRRAPCRPGTSTSRSAPSQAEDRSLSMRRLTPSCGGSTTGRR